MKTGMDAINEVLPKIEIKPVDMELAGGCAYYLKGKPTVILGNKDDAFTLNTPSILVELDKTHTYMDRVLVPINADETYISRVARMMKFRADSFSKENSTDEFFKTQHYGFQMPGYEGRYGRQCEDGLNIEIRYCLEIYREK